MAWKEANDDLDAAIKTVAWLLLDIERQRWTYSIVTNFSTS